MAEKRERTKEKELAKIKKKECLDKLKQQVIACQTASSIYSIWLNGIGCALLVRAGTTVAMYGGKMMCQHNNHAWIMTVLCRWK